MKFRSPKLRYAGTVAQQNYQSSLLPRHPVFCQTFRVTGRRTFLNCFEPVKKVNSFILKIFYGKKKKTAFVQGRYPERPSTNTELKNRNLVRLQTDNTKL